MSLQNSKKDLSYQNPWWNDGGLYQDTDLNRIKSSSIFYHPKPIGCEELKPDGVFTLRGPRRSGKTVALKLLVAEVIEKGIYQPHEILWLNFDTLRNLSQAEELLESAVARQKPKLIFIDEVTSLKNWQKLIKKFRDIGILANKTTILTGSSAFDLKIGAERMAGRKGLVKNSERVLLPMTFTEFSLQFRELQKTPLDLFQFFLKVGGFPFRVEEAKRFVLRTGDHLGFDEKTGFDIFDDVLFYEFNRRKLDRNTGLAVLERSQEVGCSAVSYQAFSKPLGIAKETARKYLDALGDAFLLATISSYDFGRGRISLKKDKKIMWIDPAFGAFPAWLGSGSPQSNSVRAEWYAGTCLIRNFEKRLFEGISAPRSVFTWKSSSGKEIDYLIIDKNKKLILPIEIKYQSSISDWDFMVLEKSFKKGWLVTENREKKRLLSEAFPAFQLERKIERFVERS